MSQGGKPIDTDKQKRQAGKKRDEQGGAARSSAESKGWPAVNKLPGGGKKIDARRKLPSGPLGGSGRKTNLSRSS